MTICDYNSCSPRSIYGTHTRLLICLELRAREQLSLSSATDGPSNLARLLECFAHRIGFQGKVHSWTLLESADSAVPIHQGLNVWTPENAHKKMSYSWTMQGLTVASSCILQCDAEKTVWKAVKCTTVEVRQVKAQLRTSPLHSCYHARLSYTTIPPALPLQWTKPVS